MDLVTLVAGCALVVEPKIMHALIWHQSGGEPWSFSVPGERQPQVYHIVRDAIGAVRAIDRDDMAIRLGLTGLSANPRSVTAAMFAPCPNISVAARQIAGLGERCKTIPRFKADPIHCAIAAYHGSWDRPDSGFADAVTTSVAKGDAPNFDMPKDTKFDFVDVGAAIPPPVRNSIAAPTVAPDDRQRAWSSALFPAKGQRLDSPSTKTSTSDARAADLQEREARSAVPPTATLQADGLFVPRSPERRPQ
jgi:hypothetical protein